MTRLEAAAFVEALDEQSAEALEDAAHDFAHAVWMSRISAPSRKGFWGQQLVASRERLIDRLSGSESTIPTPRPL
jgi:hypothetical protein